MNKNFLDARELEHPKPLEEAIKALRELDNDSYFYMIHRKNPIPLINLAQKENFSLVSYEEKEDTWHILISKNSEIELNSLIEKSI
jgi:TusA-related sulfurtransferase